MTAPAPGAALLIGAGRMGGALIKGWLSAKRFSAIHVIEPFPSEAMTALAGTGAIVLHPRFEIAGVPALDAAVLAVKPQVLKGETALLRALGGTGALVVSIAAGITTGFLGASLGSSARLVRAMPNTPGAIGQGITVLYADAGVGGGDRNLAQMLMGSLGETLWLDDEALMDAVTAVSGSGPAYVFLMAEALADAGRAQGLDEATAERLARATISGAGALLAADARGAAELRKEVTSPGGTTEAALTVLTAPEGLRELMTRAIAAATLRGKQLGQG
ncbi:MAG TPA: pyrroline-5-carboxylate reductase [Micropepsaceae bacterium]|jgi:pyrroline-5-carboxylate reductase|nr:pyrroline-5-carboxylate reductase [Micropepsaceae bacterium]